MIWIRKRRRFSEKEAQVLAQRHIGMLGFARRERGRCEVGVLRAIGDPHVLGEGRSFRRAFESAGVFFKVRGKDQEDTT